MIDVPWHAWLLFLALAVLASILGVLVARWLPWAEDARRRKLEFLAGVSLAPFLLGLSSVAALAFLPGASHAIHGGVIASVLVVSSALLFWFGRSRPPVIPAAGAAAVESGRTWERLAWLLLSASVIALFVHATCLPLTQSDSLEYSMAGRVLFHARTLDAYPPVDPVADAAGFYGPWTHPPLYPALIYAAYICQGHVQDPGLMRLISPWALTCAAVLIFVIGSQRGRLSGVFAALLLVCPPLLFLGADSGLLDAFPVLALTLTLAALLGFDWGRRASAPALGLLVGIGLWTHSQAVLLLPLSLTALFFSKHGFADFAGFVRNALKIIGFALLVGMWPYLDNLARTGQVISDNPAVFALPQLDWEDYFRKARDFDAISARIQYGVFKGWFALESYSLAFWIMSFGVLAIVTRRVIAESRSWPSRDSAEGIALAILCCYYGGVIVSTIVGIDLMIKTERYLLIIMPCVALLGAYGLSRAADPQTSRMVRVMARIAIVGFLALMLAQLYALTRYRWGSFGLTPADIALPVPQKLERWPPFESINYLRTESPPGAFVLTLKPSDMFYARRRMITFLDPRMIGVYEAGTALQAYQKLRELGISHVHQPDYSIPPLYNSPLYQVLADERMARLAQSRAGYQVYELWDPVRDVEVCPDLEAGPAALAWFIESGYVFGGRKRLFEIAAAQHRIAPDGSGQARPMPLLFQRDFSTRVTSEIISMERLQRIAGEVACLTGQQLRVEFELKGRGFAHLFVEQLAADGTSLGEEGIGGTALDARSPTRSFARRFLLRSDSAAIRLSVEYRGTSVVSITDVRIRTVLAE